MDVLKAQIETTAILIREEGLDVALKRLPPPVSDQAGGWTFPDEDDRVTLDPVRRYFGSVREQGVYEHNTNGNRFTTGHVLIGMPDDDIRVDDTFELWGHEYKVEYVQPDRRYQTKAYVERHASP